MYSASRCSRYAGFSRSTALAMLLLLCAPFVAAKDFRVCADPDNLPFSRADGSGFENRIAATIAADLGVELRYVWVRQGRGFVRKTLDARLCDALIGWPAGADDVLTTAPYYSARYRFVFGDARLPGLDSYDDPRLRRLKIGIPLIGDDAAEAPPAHALARRGIADNVRGFPVYATDTVMARMRRALADGDIDVAVLWGPQAGFLARASRGGLVSRALDDPTVPEPAFAMAFAVRRDDVALRDTLEVVRRRHQADIDRILDDFGVARDASVPTPAGAQ
jgi:mxaJ protein